MFSTKMCAHKDCNAAGIGSMNEYLGTPEQKRWRSKDNTLLFCPYHLPVVANIYRSYKQIEWAHCHLLETKVLKRAIQLRRRLTSLLRAEVARASVGHTWYLGEMERTLTIKLRNKTIPPVLGDEHMHRRHHGRRTNWRPLLLHKI